jgi:hypothetical protein
MEVGAESPVARRLRCNLAEFTYGLGDAPWEMSVYCELYTGEVIPDSGVREGPLTW